MNQKQPRFPTTFSPTHVKAIIRDHLPTAEERGWQSFAEIDEVLKAGVEPLKTVRIDGNPVLPPARKLRVAQDGQTVPVPLPVVLADTREQRPYDFKRFRKWIARVENATLKTGDYTVQGCESLFAVERKRLDDLAGALTGGRERFIRELARLGKMKRAAIVIEASLARVKTPQCWSEVSPNALSGSLAAIAARWNIQIVFASCRDLAEEWTASLLSKWWAYHWLRENGYRECLIDGDL